MPPKKTSARPKNQLGLLAGMDKDIESAKHDDIMLWTDKNLSKILPNLLPLYFGTGWATHHQDMLETLPKGTTGFYYVYPRAVPYQVDFQRPPYEITTKAWEYPIKDKKGGLVGFTDLFVEATYYTMDYPLTKEEKNFGAAQHTVQVYFEIKTTIQLGQLIRQINLYRMHIGGYFAVVSPDTRYDETLNEQEVLFVAYAP